MRSVTIAVLLAIAVFASAVDPLELVEDLVAAPSEISSQTSAPPVKLDKNLRRALLKALVDLEAESAEQQQQKQLPPQKQQLPLTDYGDEEIHTTEPPIDETKYDFLEISKQKSASFSFDGFPNEEDIPSEDKLQNSSFVEADKYTLTDSQLETKRKQSDKDYVDAVQVHHVVSSEKATAIYEGKPAEQLESVESRNIALSSSSSAPSSTLNQIQESVMITPITKTIEMSASGNLVSAAANSLIIPRPTVSTKSPSDENDTIKKEANTGSRIIQITSKQSKQGTEDVKIFQAPLVAAFTVQQDERGIPKSVVPLYKSNTESGSGSQSQPLSLQEQLEFKQRLLEKQLFQLQLQQAQQTQLLIRQRQTYEEQLRQKQHHEYYLQEQRRIKQLQEQEQQHLVQQQRLIQQQRLQQQQQQFTLTPVQRLPQQPSFQLQQQQLNLVQQLPQKQQEQPFKLLNIPLQPSLGLEVPNTHPAPSFHDQQHQLHRPLIQQHQQRQHSFQQPFSIEFQQLPAITPLTRFNRQEGFGSIGNLGFNGFQPDEVQRNNAQFFPQRPQSQNNFIFGGLRQQQRPFSPQSSTPARQIQELLYQSGIAGDLQGAGTRNQEDVNIVSKVLALNVGALPNGGQILKSFHQQPFDALKK